MASPKSCAILGHNPMRFAWGFDEEAAECHDTLLSFLYSQLTKIHCPHLKCLKVPEFFGNSAAKHRTSS